MKVFEWLIDEFNSYGASVAQEQQEKVRRDRETNNGRLIRAKTLAIRGKYSMNKGLSMDPHLVFSYNKNNEAQWWSQMIQFFIPTNNTTAEFDSGISYQGIEGKNTVY